MTETQAEKPIVERRRAALPQPDFAPYISAEAYPGTGYFFVGHSYNLDDSFVGNKAQVDNRAQVLKELFGNAEHWIPAHTILSGEQFRSLLSRFERDLLTRLPDTAVIGPAIDVLGNVVPESFTIWRKEMRRRRA